MAILSKLCNEHNFFTYFEAISAIPRGSYHTKAISDYCVAEAKKLGLDYIQDQYNNVIIKKPGSKGCEHLDAIMLQGHLDMVCECEPGMDYDFINQGIELVIQDDFIHAKGTTLGGDDGIAIAYALSILADDSLIHPPLEVVFTTEEEVGMDGALNLDVSNLTAPYMINLDSEDEGVFTLACAGGSTVKITDDYMEATTEGVKLTLAIQGLQGGHSGQEIHRNRGNACKLMGYLLSRLQEQCDLRLLSLQGGLKHNAIPRYCTCEIIISPTEQEKAIHAVNEYSHSLSIRYANSDPHVECICMNAENGTYKAATPETTKTHIAFLTLVPDGLQSMSQIAPGIPETSLNVGIVRIQSGKGYYEISNRSENKEALSCLELQLKCLANSLAFTYEYDGGYPGWPMLKDSILRERMCHVFKELYQYEPKLESIHAGLECGILKEKMPHLDIVSIGPDLLDIHTPKERLSISSANRTYEFLLAILKEFTCNVR